MILESILSLTKSFKDPIINLFKEAKHEISFLFDDGLPKYLSSYKAKFENTKTFLYRDLEVNFYETYVKTSLKRGETIYEINTLEDLYKNNNCTTIIGGAGSGKSMQMKFLFLQAIKQKIKIPIYIELRSLNKYEGDITSFIYDKILNNKLSNSTGILERILSTGNFIFLFDGYDELYSAKKQTITNNIEEFIDIYNHNWFVITSRPQAGIESFPRFSNNYILPLKKDQIKNFIVAQCLLIKDVELGDNIISSLENDSSQHYYHYLTNPLFLSMFLFAYRGYPNLPTQRSKFYWNVFDTLLTRHNAFVKQGGWQHERISKLDNSNIELIIYWLSYLSYFNDDYIFDRESLLSYLSDICTHLDLKVRLEDLIYDLSVNIGILVMDGLLFSFPHRSLQEYFASKFISKQKEDPKKEIYKDILFHKTKDNPTGSFRTLFNLLIELDEHYFKKYFAVPNITALISKFEPNTPEKLIQSYYNITHFNYTIELQADQYKVKVKSSRIVDIGLRILHYFSIVNTHSMEEYEMKRIFNSNEFMNSMNNIVLTSFPIRKEETLLNYEAVQDARYKFEKYKPLKIKEEDIQILKKMNFHIYVQNLLDLTKQYILNLENELSKHLNSTNSLLKKTGTNNR